MVDLEAVKHNLAGLGPDEIPDLRESLSRGMKLLIPVAVLLIMLIGFKVTPMRLAIWATAAILVMGFLDSKERMTFKSLLDGAVAAGKAMCSVVSACSTAGIVVAVFSLTGLGLNFPTSSCSLEAIP